MIAYIEAVQGLKNDPRTGMNVLCPGRIYHMFDYNCGDFVDEVEEFALHQLEGKLTKLDRDTPMVPSRKVVPKYQEYFYQSSILTS